MMELSLSEFPGKEASKALTEIRHLCSEFIKRSSAKLDQTQVCETLKFLWLISTGHNCAHRLISVSLDEAWHEMIIDTRFYHDACQALPGRFFIHHEPIHVSSSPSDSETALCFLALAQYVRQFGDFSLETLCYWPAVQELAHTFGLSLSEFNARLASLRQPHQISSEPFDIKAVKSQRFVGVIRTSSSEVIEAETEGSRNRMG
jgi:hypothetical protein